MRAGQAGSPMLLALAAGQVQRVLVEAGSTLVVARGAVSVRFPFAWLAGSVVPLSVPVRAEETYRLPDGGWIDLAATAAAVDVVILPPAGAQIWERLARACGRLAAAARKEVRARHDAAAGA